MTSKNETKIKSFGVGFVMKMNGIADDCCILGTSLHKEENCIAFCRLCVAGIVALVLLNSFTYSRVLSWLRFDVRLFSAELESRNRIRCKVLNKFSLLF